MDYLAQILTRKRAEVARRQAHARPIREALARAPMDDERGRRALGALRREGAAVPKVIAEVKFCSPSAGVIRDRRPGDGVQVARAYEQGGASVVSVLADGAGFGGCVLDVRRAACALSVPVLFKEFVLDPVQVLYARAAGAALVLLLVRVLPDAALRELVSVVRAHGMEPVVEAADAQEVERALATEARIIGVNARDLQTFRVDQQQAAECLAAVPGERLAVFMSGVRSRDDLEWTARTRADAVLVGEGLMRARDPRQELRSWLGGI